MSQLQVSPHPDTHSKHFCFLRNHSNGSERCKWNQFCTVLLKALKVVIKPFFLSISQAYDLFVAG